MSQAVVFITLNTKKIIAKTLRVLIGSKGRGLLFQEEICLIVGHC